MSKNRMLSQGQLDAIFQRERGIPQAEEMRRLFEHIGALNDQLREAKSVPASRTLTFAHLRSANVYRCATHYHPIDDWSPNEWMGAVTGETGELASALTNIRRQQTEVGGGGHGIPAVTLQNVGDEAADVVIYLDLLCARMGIDLGEAVVRKFNHVSTERLGDGPLLTMMAPRDQGWAKPGVWAVWDESTGIPTDDRKPARLIRSDGNEWMAEEADGTPAIVMTIWRRPATTEETAQLESERNHR